MYGIDTENERIFLPRNNYFEQMTGDVSEVGKSIEAGLPNITGQFATRVGTVSNLSSIIEESGAFKKEGTKGSTYNKVSLADNQNTHAEVTKFNASRSNPIYNNSDTVQPNAVKKLLYICVGNTINYEGMAEVVNQGVEILEQVNQGLESRLNLDITNITNDGKKSVMSWGLPDYANMIIVSTATLPNGTYTAPCDGLMLFDLSMWKAVGHITVNGVDITRRRSTAEYMTVYSFSLPINKGDVVNFYCNYNNTYPSYSSNEVKFVPLKGAK